MGPEVAGQAAQNDIQVIGNLAGNPGRLWQVVDGNGHLAAKSLSQGTLDEFRLLLVAVVIVSHQSKGNLLDAQFLQGLLEVIAGGLKVVFHVLVHAGVGTFRFLGKILPV